MNKDNIIKDEILNYCFPTGLNIELTETNRTWLKSKLEALETATLEKAKQDLLAVKRCRIPWSFCSAHKTHDLNEYIELTPSTNKELNDTNVANPVDEESKDCPCYVNGQQVPCGHADPHYCCPIHCINKGGS